MTLNIVLIVIVVFIFGALWNQGLWNNTISLFNVILAAIIATCFFEPVAQLLTTMALPSAVHAWDILSAGLLFIVSYSVLKLLTDRLSKYRVRFHPVAEKVGGAIVALWIGWTAVCFICFTLHLAPLTRNFLNGGFNAEEKMFFGLQPDRLWLGFVQRQSNNGGLGRNSVDKQGRVVSMFDPKSEFMIKYASRRTWLDQQESLLVN
jgi:hypothetical protein